LYCQQIIIAVRIGFLIAKKNDKNKAENAVASDKLNDRIDKKYKINIYINVNLLSIETRKSERIRQVMRS